MFVLRHQTTRWCLSQILLHHLTTDVCDSYFDESKDFFLLGIASIFNQLKKAGFLSVKAQDYVPSATYTSCICSVNHHPN